MLTALKAMDIPQAQVNAMYETREDYVDEQKAQMQAGENSDGGIIGTYQNAAYALRKTNPVARNGNVDLRDKGDFYAGIFASPDSEGFIVDSTDNKSEMLQQKYGANIFGLNSKFKTPYTQKLAVPFFSDIEKQLNRK